MRRSALDLHVGVFDHLGPLRDFALDEGGEFSARGRRYLDSHHRESIAHLFSMGRFEGVVVYASDYCHWDCKFPDTVKILAERTDLSAGTKRRIFTDNPRRLYGFA